MSALLEGSYKIKWTNISKKQQISCKATSALEWNLLGKELSRNGETWLDQKIQFKQKFMLPHPLGQLLEQMELKTLSMHQALSNRKLQRWIYSFQVKWNPQHSSPIVPAAWLSHMQLLQDKLVSSLIKFLKKDLKSPQWRCSILTNQLLKNSLRFMREFFLSLYLWWNRWPLVLASWWR